MNGLEFIYGLLKIASIDTIFGFLVYVLWKFIDMKYFSNMEIEQLRNENRYLKEENKKISGTSTDFWEKNNDNLY